MVCGNDTEAVCCWSLFRTVWYEMCSGSWPYKKQVPESIIWQVGKGVKQSLAHIDVPREVKVCGESTSSFASSKLRETQSTLY